MEAAALRSKPATPCRKPAKLVPEGRLREKLGFYRRDVMTEVLFSLARYRFGAGSQRGVTVSGFCGRAQPGGSLNPIRSLSVSIVMESAFTDSIRACCSSFSLIRVSRYNVTWFPVGRRWIM